MAIFPCAFHHLLLLLLLLHPVSSVDLYPITVYQPALDTLLPTKASLAASLRTAVSQASAQGSLLFICPELYMTGYNPTAVFGGEAKGGPSYTATSALALEFNISILYTYAESSAGHLYDSAVLFNRSGVPLIDYRKVNLAGDGEALVFTPGDKIAPVVEVDGVRLGALVCFDIYLPEPARLLALQSADIILVPTANGYPGNVYNQLTQLIVPTRGLENNAWVVYCNWFQAHSSNSSTFPEIFSFYGQSTVTDPGGGLVWRGASDKGELAHLELNFTGRVRGGTAQGRPPADTQGLCAL
jgi:predicted amidohydrolase